MTIEKNVSGETITLKLGGWMDTQSAPALEEVLQTIGPEVKRLVLDLGELEYTSSAGVREIVAAHKRMNGEMTLRNVRPEVLDVLTMTGVTKRLNIEP